jgi:NADH-quinone oxidoreductase subunit G
MEFLLIHHPLDCPICDQCGECRLQDYSFEYGRDKSRFSEKKNVDPPLSLGKTLSHNQNRCINCTRCIRFMRDAASDECLGLSERGGRTIVGTYIDKPVDNPFSVNIADICPVGALTEKHFRFKARPWLMDKTDTLCPGCARGCNVTAWSYKGEILRLTPRVNEAVNLEWLCDEGRVSFDRSVGPERLYEPVLNGEQKSFGEVFSCLADKIRAAAPDEIGIMSSAALTNEDNFAVRTLADKIGTKNVYLIGPEKDDRPFGPEDGPLAGWFVRKDKFPNARGAADMLGDTRGLPELLEDIADGKVKGLLIFGADPVGADSTAASVFEKLEWTAVQDTFCTQTTAAANMVLPEASAFEKQGTFTNEGNRLQKIAPCISSPEKSRSAWQTAGALCEILDGAVCFFSAAEVFEAISKTVPAYQNISLAQIGALGVPLRGDEGE